MAYATHLKFTAVYGHDHVIRKRYGNDAISLNELMMGIRDLSIDDIQKQHIHDAHGCEINCRSL